MSLFQTLEISATGLTAERARMDVIAENLANANTTRAAGGGPYQRKQVVLQARPVSFSASLRSAQSSFADSAPVSFSDDDSGSGAGGGVEVAAIQPDPAPGRKVYNPSHPDADAQGYVTLPNVNPVTEMTDLITASRSYEANATVMGTAKTSFIKTLDVLK